VKLSTVAIHRGFISGCYAGRMETAILILGTLCAILVFVVDGVAWAILCLHADVEGMMEEEGYPQEQRQEP
jgi:hypothetical protein